MSRVSRIGWLLLPVAIFSVASPGLHAVTVEVQTSSRTLWVDERDVSSGFELFPRGPQWFLDALYGPASTRGARAWKGEWSLDPSVDRTAQGPAEVGTLRDVFDVSLFNNVSTFPRLSSTKTVATIVADLATTYTYSGTTNNTVDQWSAGTHWSPSAPVSAPDTTLTFGGGASLASGDAIFTNNDIAGHFQLNKLNFNYAGPASGTQPEVTISGNRLNFISDGATAPSMSIAATGAIKPLLTISNDFLLTNNLTIAASSDAVFSGTISGGGSLTKNGAGTLTLTGSNTYSGATTINGGTLVLGNATNTLANNAFIDVVAGTLSLGNNSDTVGNVVLETGSITGTGGTLTSTNYDFRSGSVTANLAGTGTAMFKSSSGTLTLTGTNSYSGGTTINGGDVWFNNASALGSGAINFGPNGLDSMSLMSTAPAVLTNNIAINDLSPTPGRTATLGSFSNAASGANAYTGNIVLNNNLNIKSSSPVSNPLTFSTGVISGSQGLIINPSGTLSPGAVKLAGENTYAGNTSIAAGLLLVTGGTTGSLTSSGTGTGNVTVTGSGTILAGGSSDGFTGTILGTVNIGSTSKLSPGTTGDGTNTTAILHTGALTLSSGSIYTLNINGTTAGTTYDQVISSGAMTFTGSTLVVTVGGPLQLDQKFFILQNSSTNPNTVGLFSNGATVTSGGYTFLIEYFDNGDGGLLANDISLTVTAIPETSTWVIGALALGAIGLMGRKRFARRLRVIR